MTRKDPKPFDPAPWKPGSVVQVNGNDYTVWSAGPKPASVWVHDDAGNFLAVKLPTKSRGAVVLDDDPRKPLADAEAVRNGAFLVRDTYTYWSGWERKNLERYDERVHVLAECPEAQKSLTLSRPVQKATERVELSPGRRHYLATLTLRGAQPAYGETLCLCIRNRERLAQDAA